MDEVKKIVVVVEDEEASRTALRWALHNLFRYGDILILLHVFPSTTSRASSSSSSHHSSSSSNRKNKKKKKKKPEFRRLRRHGYQLVVSFKELCSDFFNTRIEMIVAEEEDDVGEGDKIVALVREIEPFALVAGIHDRSFLYQLAETYNNDLVTAFNCRVLAIKQPTTVSPTPPAVPVTVRAAGGRGQLQVTSTPVTIAQDHLSTPSPADYFQLGFSQVEVSTGLVQRPQLIQPQKIPYRVCPSPYAIIWRRSKKTRRRA